MSGSGCAASPGLRALALLVALMGAPGCLVLSVNPAYDSETVGFDPALVGTWQDTDDNATMVIERGEWRSYKVHYVHPIETGDLTGYITAIDDVHYLDLMPARGEDHGSFLIPVHAILRVQVSGDELELTPLAYDWIFDRVGHGRPVSGLDVAVDQKQNALIISPVVRLRAWLRAQRPSDPVFGAAARFVRVQGSSLPLRGRR